MHNFVVHSNESACWKSGCLGLDQVKKEDGGNVSDGKNSRKSLGTTKNEKVDSTKKGCGTLNSDGGSHCTQQPEKMTTLKRRDPVSSGDKKVWYYV